LDGDPTVGWTHALLSTAKLATLFNLPLAIAAIWLLWRSLDWPLVGDATIFHFIAGQVQMGAVPYRDIVDINMPLIYYIHAAVVAIGGMSDVAWRAFDLTCRPAHVGLDRDAGMARGASCGDPGRAHRVGDPFFA
jgi:hypothetical protein